MLAFALGVGVVVVFAIVVRRAAFDRSDIVLVGSVDFLDAVFGEVFGKRVSAFILGVIFVAGGNAFFLFLGAQALFFLCRFGIGREKCITVSLGDLVIVGMDLAKGEEPVAIAAEVDESRLQRGLDPGYLCKIDVTLDLLVFGRFKIEFLNPVALQNRHPCFFRVARIDKHARCHSIVSMRPAFPAKRSEGGRALCGEPARPKAVPKGIIALCPRRAPGAELVSAMSAGRPIAACRPANAYTLEKRIMLFCREEPSVTASTCIGPGAEERCAPAQEAGKGTRSAPSCNLSGSIASTVGQVPQLYCVSW